MYVRASLNWRRELNAQTVADLFGVDVLDVHKYCSKVKSGIEGRIQFKRLYHTPGVDYYPFGQYGGALYFAPSDGAKNPFLRRYDPAKRIQPYSD